MDNREAKSKAEAAVAYTTTYEEAVSRLKETYKVNRDLHSHHMAELYQTDHIRDERRDLERILDRLERSIRGLKLANGYTADQMLTTHIEGLLSSTLRTQWKKSSFDQSDTPTVDVLISFLKKQLKSSSALSLIKRDSDSKPYKKDREPPHRQKPTPRSPG